uniref:Uncharacterized protein n=1 Tax=Anguilla anguilla TaxID=7936 RepID=A0A0E9X0B2_ANGAN
MVLIDVERVNSSQVLHRGARFGLGKVLVKHKYATKRASRKELFSKFLQQCEMGFKGTFSACPTIAKYVEMYPLKIKSIVNTPI